ncbi:MAG: oligosaccharide flippase family protein [Candidatus Hydrogenedentes bacterium]|nr:oligosaccharide flippase family protein [Candidatus Hydrogenedentota bacterium]
MTETTDASVSTGPSLKRRAIRGSFWVIGGTGISQGARFASSLILTRLLFPEALGQMLVVTIFMQGLHMFLDFSIGTSIIQNKRGNEPEFLRTAWTVQIVRGFIIWLCACAIAWPAAMAYGQPEIIGLLSAAAFVSVIEGFHSTVLATLDKNLIVGKQTRIEVGTQLAGIVATICVCYLFPSVWSLLVGSYTTAIVKLVVSHKVYGGVRMGLRWEAQARAELFHFGKWLLLSSVLGFILSRSDRLVLGYLGIGTLGVSSLAYNLTQAPIDVAATLSSRILYPLYAQLIHHNPADLRRKVLRARAGTAALSLPLLCGLSVFGPLLIRLCYDKRYDDATWMLTLIAGGATVPAITNSISQTLLAVGDSFRFMLLLVSRSCLLIVSMTVAGKLYGVPGILLSTAVAELLNYPMLAYCVRKHGMWLPWLDGALFVVSLTAIGAGLELHNLGYF